VSELDEHKLTVEIESTGERIQSGDAIQSYRLESDYLTPADAFQFTVYNDADPASLRRKFRPLMRVKLYIDGELQLLGRIDSIEGTGNSGSALLVKGRDYVAELVDGGADPAVKFTDKMDLGAALLLLWRPFGIRTLVGNFNLTRNLLTGRIPVVNFTPRDFHEAKLTDFTVRAGDGAFQAGDRLVSRHGFTIQQGGERGTLCIVEPMYGQEPLEELVRGENMMTGRAIRDYGDAPTVTITTGRVKASEKTRDATLFGRTAGVGQSAKPTANQVLPALVQFPTFGELSPNELGKFDEVKQTALEPTSLLRQARVDPYASTMPFEPQDDVLYRPLFVEDKDSRTDEQMERVARRELSRRVASCLSYRATMRGHRELKSRAVFTVDTMWTVKDAIEDVNQRMWVKSRSLYNDGSGPRSDIELILPGAIAL
jgi:prophage tail gpP-like protein